MSSVLLDAPQLFSSRLSKSTSLEERRCEVAFSNVAFSRIIHKFVSLNASATWDIFNRLDWLNGSNHGVKYMASIVQKACMTHCLP